MPLWLAAVYGEHTVHGETAHDKLHPEFTLHYLVQGQREEDV